MLKSDAIRESSFTCFKAIEVLERRLEFSLLTKQQQRTVQHVMDALTTLIEELDAKAEAQEAVEKVDDTEQEDADAARAVRIASLHASITKREADIITETRRAELLHAEGNEIKAGNLRMNVLYNQRTLDQERRELSTLLASAPQPQYK